jgi:hypothetical protein
MQIVGFRQFVELPGTKTHQLPPLFVPRHAGVKHLDRVMQMANELVENEQLIPICPGLDPVVDAEIERRKMDLAVNLVEAYLGFVAHWRWGDSILEWIRQCEITFEARAELRPLLRPDVWPHAGRSSFVTLIEDKEIPHPKIRLDQAVGLRLTFRQPPPLACFSDQFLLYLNSTVAKSAYHAWAEMTPGPQASLPPERFSFELVEM